MIAMELVGVRLEQPANTPVVMLREIDGRHRVLPIYIGSPEAAAIHYAIEGIVPPRPLTHDLVRTLISELGAELRSVVVTAIEEHTFFAELHLMTGDVEHVVSSRPSDAIAIAIRTGSPIFANDSVLDAAATDDDPASAPTGEADKILADFSDFIDNVSPDDFA